LGREGLSGQRIRSTGEETSFLPRELVEKGGIKLLGERASREAIGKASFAERGKVVFLPLGEEEAP